MILWPAVIIAVLFVLRHLCALIFDRQDVISRSVDAALVAFGVYALWCLR